MPSCYIDDSRSGNSSVSSIQERNFLKNNLVLSVERLAIPKAKPHGRSYMLIKKPRTVQDFIFANNRDNSRSAFMPGLRQFPVVSLSALCYDVKYD